MKSQGIVTGALLVAALIPAGVATTGDRLPSRRERAVVNFEHPTKVATEILMGRYLVVHDEAKMARGEPCTSLYPLEPVQGSRQEAVSFMCIPRTRPLVNQFTIATEWEPSLGMYTLTEYQFAGDREGHGVPGPVLASNDVGVETSVACAR